MLGIVGGLLACTTVTDPYPKPPTPSQPSAPSAPAPSAQAPVPDGPWADDNLPLPPAVNQPKSRWVPVRWRDLPGVRTDAFGEAFAAWIKSCERPAATIGALCPEVKRLANASATDQLDWMVRRLQPYRIEPIGFPPGDGLLTAYYEPVMNATRVPRPGFAAALHRAPANLGARKPWYSRQEIDTLAQAQAALRGREIAYLADPIDVLILQIQGSGRLRVTEADGSQRLVRVAFAASNDQPYQSVGRWLQTQAGQREVSWPAIKAWAQQNPTRVTEMLHSNPRVIFFREEAVDGDIGPKGAQGVPLTAGRSIAIDRGSIPYGTPVWLASSGPGINLQRLVMAQDTGSAITGAVRADYYTGSGDAAGELANRVKQPLQLWVLWPR